MPSLDWIFVWLMFAVGVAVGHNYKKRKLEEENDLLQDALYHSGYDWDDCIDCGGPPHDEHCRFWKLRHLFPLWFEGQEDNG